MEDYYTWFRQTHRPIHPTDRMCAWKYNVMNPWERAESEFKIDVEKDRGDDPNHFVLR
jgi:hypothetical protein